jgi:hypothetical protein
VRVAQAMALAEIGPEGSRLALQGLLSQQAAALPQLSEAIGRRYFNLVEKGVRWVRARSRADQ